MLLAQLFLQSQNLLLHQESRQAANKWRHGKQGMTHSLCTTAHSCNEQQYQEGILLTYVNVLITQ